MDKIVYEIIDTMTRRPWASPEGRRVFKAQFDAIGTYNSHRHQGEPCYSAQTRYRIRAVTIGVVNGK